MLRGDTWPRCLSTSLRGAERSPGFSSIHPLSAKLCLPTEVELVFDGDHRPHSFWFCTLPPQFYILHSFLPQVDEGGRAPLSFHHFFATDDYDNLQGDAVIKLSALPKYGCIENTGTGNHVTLLGDVLGSGNEGDSLIKQGD